MDLLARLLGRPLSPQPFARRVRAALAEAGVARLEEITYDADQFSLTTPLGTLYLGNVYAEYVAAPRGQRDAAISALVATLVQMQLPPPTPDQARAQLIAQLRPRTFADLSAPVVHRVVAERLALCLCLDTPLTLQYFTPDRLVEWDLDEETAFTVALAHLERRSAEPLAQLERLPTGLYRSTWQDTFDATRAILPSVVGRVPAAGGRAVGIPNRNTLLVADLADERALRALVAETRAAYDHPRAVSARLYVPIDGGLEPLRLPDGHPLARDLRELDLLDLAGEYATQTEALNQRHAAEGLDLFVASFRPNETDDGRIYSYAVWTEGVPTLLPETDLVALVEQPVGTDVAFSLYPFERVRAVAADLLEPVQCYPPRYRTLGFPTPEQRDALGPPVSP